MTTPAATPPPTLIPCPACGQNLSVHAVNCPHCGHPLKAAPGHTWREVKEVGGLVGAVLVVLGLGTQTAILKFVSASEMSEVGARTEFNVFLQTAPLTVAVMLVALSILQKWWTEYSSTIFFAWFVMMVSIFMGSAFGGLGDISSVKGNVFHFFYASLALYWRHYGASLFISSLVLGGFLAWALAKLLPARAASSH